jgi:hypothetical protein
VRLKSLILGIESLILSMESLVLGMESLILEMKLQQRAYYSPIELDLLR